VKFDLTCNNSYS